MVAPAASLSTGRAGRHRSLSHDVAFPVSAGALIVATADVHLPLGLPGHRGLIWLTLLVAVTLTTRRETVLAVAAASTLGMVVLHGASWPAGQVLLAGALLYAVGSLPLGRLRYGWTALAAAPIHLVALAGPLLGAPGLGTKAAFHLGFGLAAGLLGAVTARLLNPHR